MTAKEILERLNITDEIDAIEAKAGKSISHSVMETVCAFSNEPGLGGGYILIGAVRDDASLFPSYHVDEVLDPDKIQSDLASQCGSIFNIPVRPSIKIEQVNGKNIVVVKVDELPDDQKPLFFKHEKLPGGAFRRIGPTDHRCTEDDMPVFYSDRNTYDKSLLQGTSIEDVDEAAINRYRTLRAKVNPAAEELTYTDEELLQSLGCMENTRGGKLSVAGLLLFGQSRSLRREFPMIRADYIRVPGNKWVEDPDDRFTSIDMRGPLLLLIYRLVDAIYSDLPKGFRIEENDLQADSVGVPVKALREALTNALMHRSYRNHAPIQIIRYDNRLEIINPGYSLKSEDKLGTPGSETRNPFIASVFHETNLAETKGSGIRAMRRLLAEAHLAPPTFESNRTDNKFTTRLLLHHFLSDADLLWLTRFEALGLNDYQKQALIFVRETGAIDNLSYRQLSDTDTLRSSIDLRQLRDWELLQQKGKGRGTYYVPGNEFLLIGFDNMAKIGISKLIDGKVISSTEVVPLPANNPSVTTEPQSLNTEPRQVNTEPRSLNTEASTVNTEALLSELPVEVQVEIGAIKAKERDQGKIYKIVLSICSVRPYSLDELSTILKRDTNWVSRKYIKPLIDQDELEYLYPEMINHPQQAYRTKKS